MKTEEITRNYKFDLETVRMKLGLSGTLKHISTHKDYDSADDKALIVECRTEQELEHEE